MNAEAQKKKFESDKDDLCRLFCKVSIPGHFVLGIYALIRTAGLPPRRFGRDFVTHI